MTKWMPKSVRAAAMLAAALALAGCSSFGGGSARTARAPEQLTPIQTPQVASSNLPAIGADGQPVQGTSVGPVNPNLTGQPVLGTADPLQTANNEGFVTLDSVGTVPTTGGRDLTGGLSVQKLLGGWTVVSGPTQCKLNLTQSEKPGTTRYRASSPACALPGLAVVASWQLAGSQVQLFDEAGTMIAALILSGSQFIGTVAGGQAITMVS